MEERGRMYKRIQNNKDMQKIANKMQDINRIKIMMVEVNEPKEQKMFKSPNVYLSKYGGKRDESLADWLRQFRNFTRLYDGFDEDNLHLFAGQWLIGDAGIYIDDLYPQPATWTEFKAALEKRFGRRKLDKTILMRKVLNRKQQINEDTLVFCQEMMADGIEANIEEETIVQSMLNNMTDPNKMHFIFFLSNDLSYDKLTSLIETSRITSSESCIKTNTNQESERDPEIKYMIDKIDNLTLSVKEMKGDSYLRKEIYCRNCGRKGHISYNCRAQRNEVTTKHLNAFDKNESREKNKNNAKIEEIENLLGRRIEGTIKDFRENFKIQSSELKNIFKIIPEHFYARTTIAKNDIFAFEILRQLKMNKKDLINLAQEKQHEVFDILKAQIEINHQLIETVIDTGANFSVISKNLVERLELPMCKQEISNITVANNDIVKTIGKINELKMNINENIYTCEAIVLEDTAQDLLLGTNFLAKYHCIIDFKKPCVKILRKDDLYDILAVSATKLQLQNMRTWNTKKNKRFKCYAAERTKVKMQEYKKIEILFDEELNKNMDHKDVGLVNGTNTEKQVLRGAFDLSNPMNSVFIANTSNRDLIIEKGEIIGDIEILRSSSITQATNNMNREATIEKLLSCYKGDPTLSNNFRDMLYDIKFPDHETTFKDIQHSIKLKTENENIYCRPYRLSPKDREYVDKSMKEMIEQGIIRDSCSKFASPMV
ncbi:RNA-binding protein with serine-rich domain 1 [Conglomerata obtusa]